MVYISFAEIPMVNISAAEIPLVNISAAGIQHEHVPIRIGSGDHKTEEFTKLNPFNKVPVIQVRVFT